MSFPESTVLGREEVINPTSDQRHPLGARGVTVDGRVYRYARAGSTALGKGKVVQGPVPNSWSGATLSYISTQWPSGSTAVGTTWNYMPLTATKDSDLSVAADYFKEGYLWLSGTSTEEGQMVRIGTHSTISSADTTLLKVYFADDEYLSEVADSGSFVSMQKNEYDSVVVVPAADATAIPLGVPNCNVTATYYFWLQTWGPCPVLIDSATPCATAVQLTTSLAGGVDSSTATTGALDTAPDKVPLSYVGNAMASRCIADSFTLVHLTMAP